MATIFDLEQQLKSPFGRGSIPAPRITKTRSPRLILAPRAASPVVKASSRRVRAFGAVDYRVPGIVPQLQQPSSNSCWATVTAMLTSWRENASLSIDDALLRAAQSWVDKFRRNEPMWEADKPTFLPRIGLVAEPPVCYTVEGWENLLRAYGPLWVTTSEIPGQPFSMHARVMIGIHGDGTETGTDVDIVDPGNGRQYSEKLGAFLRKFYEEPSIPAAELVMQVIHWPAEAMSLQRSRSLQPYSRARDAGVTVAIGALGYQVLKDTLLSEGDISFQLSKMDGIKAPFDDRSYDSKATYKTTRVIVDAGQTSGKPYEKEIKSLPWHDEISAAFEVDFSYNGYCVAAVMMRNIKAIDVAGWGLQVSTELVAAAGAYKIGGVQPIAGVKIVFRYAFDPPFGDNEIYIEDLILYGNGQIDRSKRWTQ